MKQFKIDPTQAKGWFVGPWNSEVPVPIGYANEGVPIHHLHEQMYEIYLVAQGESKILVDGATITLRKGDCLVVEPNEAHTFLWNSADYLHFVIQAPFVKGDKVIVD